MDWIGFVIVGVLLNLVFMLLAYKTKIRIRGADSMPAIPIAAGFALGAGAGAVVGAILSVTYHIMRPSTLGSLPLTFIGSVIAGMLGALLSSMGFFIAGISILFVYHVISLLLMLTVSQPSPGYITFIGVNTVTTIILLIIVSGILRI